MRFALLNSGLGLLVAASELHKLRPDADLIIAMDPDGMPWGPRTPEDIAERSLTIARAAASYEPDVIVMACNTGSVHALDALRAEFEPRIPVVGTVPAIKPAAAVAGSVAIWATVATTASDYQRRLIEQFGGGADGDPGRLSRPGDGHRRGDPMATDGGHRRRRVADAERTAAPSSWDAQSTNSPPTRSASRCRALPCSALPPPSRLRRCAGQSWPASGHALNGHAAAGNGLATQRPSGTSATHTLGHRDAAGTER